MRARITEQSNPKNPVLFLSLQLMNTYLANDFNNNLYSVFPAFSIATRFHAIPNTDVPEHNDFCHKNQLTILQVIPCNDIGGSASSKRPFTIKATLRCPKKDIPPKLSHKLRNFISGYSYNGDYYHEGIAELTTKFGETEHTLAAYLDQLEKWPQPRVDEPSTFVGFASFLRRLTQKFRLHILEAHLKSSAVLRMAPTTL